MAIHWSKLFFKFAIILLQMIKAASFKGIHKTVPASGLPFEDFALVLEDYPNYLQTPANITEPCWKHLNLLRQELGRQLWTMQMLDSTGKMPSGLLRTNTKWLGNFQQCLDIHVTSNGSLEETDLRGQYCITSSNVKVNSTVLEFQNTQTFQVGICIPSSCEAPDVQNLLNQAFQVAGVEASSTVNAKYCQIQKGTHVDGPAVAIIFVLAVFLIILILGTVLDVLKLKEKENFSQKRSETIESITTANGHNSTKNLFNPRLSEKLDADNVAKNILQCFSLRTSVNSLFDVKRHPLSIDALYGIRVLSMAWIIVFHTYSLSIASGWQNMEDFGKLRQNFLAEILLNGTIAVDTFFCISGLLVVYVNLRKLHQTDGNIGLLYYYFHRYWRLTPVYAIIIGLMAGPLALVGSGPNWPSFLDITTNCRKNWWLNLLYVSNIFNLSEKCQLHCWFLASDMQLYLFSPVVLYTMFRRPRIGISIAIIVVLLSCVLNGLITYYRNLVLLAEMYTETYNRYTQEIYNKPYSRIGPYCIGMLTGFLLSSTKNSINLRMVQVAVGWSVAVICNLAIVFGLYRFISDKTEPSLVESALYISLSRSAWAIGISWLVTMCATGYGVLYILLLFAIGLINDFLSGSVFIPLGRLTYCAYIIHYNILQIYFSSRKTVWFYDDWNVMYLFLGTLVFSYILSVPFTLIFEIPMLKLEKLIMDIRGQSKTKESCATADDSKTQESSVEMSKIDDPILPQSLISTNYRTMSSATANEVKKSEELSETKSEK